MHARHLLPLIVLQSTIAQAATFTVDTTSDNVALSACTTAAADCSLRGAISASNALAGPDTIEFNIPASEPGCSAVTGICRIEVASTLQIAQGLTIDGYTQPGAQPNSIPAPGANNAQLKIEITSAGFVNLGVALFNLTNSNASPFNLSGLAVALPTSAIVTGGLRHDYRGNWFCVDAQGQSPEFTQPCSALGLSFFNRTIRVGGPSPADRNVIAGGGRDLSGQPGGGTSRLRVNSIVSERGSILLQGNLIGLAPDGNTPLPMRDPLIVQTGDDSFDTPDIQILDNRFARATGNFSGGFGGALQFSVSRTMTETALIQGNLFGLGVNGSVVGVEKDHIEVFLANGSSVPRLLIGGLGESEGNTFVGALRQSFTGTSLGSAVILPNGNVTTFVEFVGNRMLGNQGMGLDFPTATAGGGVAIGRTPNDAGDPDAGANLQQNHPNITAYSVAGSQFQLTYRVDSDPANSSYPLRVDFYKAVGDEGEVLLDSDVYGLADAQQPKTVSLMIPPGVSLDDDDVIVAIATDAQGRSSEFSFDVVAITATDTPDPQPAGLPFTVEVTALATTGPFKPNGIVDVSMNTSPVTTCSLSLVPTTAANTSRGSCQLVPVQIGNRTLTISYRTLQGAFGSASGQDVVITEPHVVTEPGPEQIGFARCRQNVVEGETAVIRVERPSGGVASVTVDFSHATGSATPGDDYTVPSNQVLQWTPGDIAAKLIEVPIAADGVPEPVERFRVNLSNAMGASILPFAQLDMEILDGQSDQRFANGFEGPACLP
ncbi:MAG: Calx-beta domain-containing protein [Lysobacterales bacterium]